MYCVTPLTPVIPLYVLSLRSLRTAPFLYKKFVNQTIHSIRVEVFFYFYKKIVKKNLKFETLDFNEKVVNKNYLVKILLKNIRIDLELKLISKNKI